MKEDREGLQSCTHTSKPHMPIPLKPHAHTLLKQQSTPPIALSLMAAGTDCPQWASTRGLLWTHAILSSLLCVFVWLLLFTRPWLRRRPAGAQTGSQIISFCSDPNTQSVTSRPTLTETLLLQLKKQKQHTCMQRKGGQACERVSCPGMPQLFGQIDSNCVLLWTQGRRCGDTPRARQDDTLETSWTLTYNKAQTSRRRGSPPRGYAADARPILWRAPSTQTRRGRANIKTPACPLSHSQRALPRMHKLNASHLFYPTGRPCCSERKQIVALHPAGIIAHQPRSELRLSRLISCSRVGMKEADRVSGLTRGQTQHGASVSASWVYHTLHGWFHPD